MHGKEFIADCIRTFFTVVSLINAVMFILGSHFMPEQQFGYGAFAAPLIYGLAGTLPNLVMYSKRELKVAELLVRKLIQLLLIEGLVLFVAFYGAGDEARTMEIVGSTAVSILVVYIIATLLDWLQNYLAAKQMTEELIRFQGNAQQ
ncbi:MAG: hypothetical protein J6K15_02980 [Lachnospiraceae bacterium]|nr:hypothetical protein [Lachnospiraceae bacterium]